MAQARRRLVTALQSAVLRQVQVLEKADLGNLGSMSFISKVGPAVAGDVGTGERNARRIVSALIEQGILTSESSRAPLCLVFPAALGSRWMPGLFPERTDERISR